MKYLKYISFKVMCFTLIVLAIIPALLLAIVNTVGLTLMIVSKVVDNGFTLVLDALKDKHTKLKEELEEK